MTGKYMAYVGSYSDTGKAKGITVYDVEVEKGQFTYRCEVEVDNSSYLKASNNGKMLYSIGVSLIGSPSTVTSFVSSLIIRPPHL